MSNIGKWDAWYANLQPDDIRFYGNTITYQIGADFLLQCETVEDWGCGMGGFKAYCKTNYRGIDGSKTPFADEICDLETYKSQVEGIFMRHVLEHNPGWKQVLANAIASFRQRMVLVLFTPFSPFETRVIANNCNDVPDIAFNRKDLVTCLTCEWKSQENLRTETQYGIEHVFLLFKE